jgi:formiminotetrahydrofolate cyclodeaminase
VIASTPLGEYTQNLGAKTPTPGGGAAAAVTGAQAAALAEMVCNFTKENEHLIVPILHRSKQIRQSMLEFGDQDIASFDALMASYKLPKTTNDEATNRTEVIQSCLIAAANVPLDMIKVIHELVPDIQNLAKLGNQNLMTDVGISACLAQATLNSSRFNVLINLRQIRNKAFREKALKVLGALSKDHQLLQVVVDEISKQLA